MELGETLDAANDLVIQVADAVLGKMEGQTLLEIEKELKPFHYRIDSETKGALISLIEARAKDKAYQQKIN